MLVMVPRAAVSGGPHQRGPRHGALDRGPARPRLARRARGRVEFRDVDVPLPGRRGAGPARHHLRGEPGRDDGHRGLDGQRQVHARSTSSRASTTRPAAASWSTAWTCATMDRQDLWQRIGMIPQKAYLFGGTVAQQPALRRRGAPSDDDLWQALEIAQGKDFVAEMAERLESPITQGGTNVSGGQRQRLAIARALVQDARHLRLRRQLLRPRLPDRRPPAGGARPGAGRRDGDHRRPARRHHPPRGPDRGPRRRRGRRHRHPRGAHGDLRDLPRDRAVPGHRGGGGMSGPTGRPGGAAGSRSPARRPGLRARPRPRPGRRPRWAWAWAPAAQVEELRAVVPAADGRAPPGAWQVVGRHRARGRQRRPSRSSGPKILGNAMNVDLHGRRRQPDGRQVPQLAGMTHDQVVAAAPGGRARRPSGRHARGLPDVRARASASTSAVLGHDPRDRRRRSTSSARSSRWGQAYIMAGVTQRTVYRLRASVSTRSWAVCRSPTSTASPAATSCRASPTTSTTSARRSSRA